MRLVNNNQECKFQKFSLQQACMRQSGAGPKTEVTNRLIVYLQRVNVERPSETFKIVTLNSQPRCGAY